MKTDLFASSSSSYDTAVVPRASRPALLSVDTLLTYYAIGGISLAESSVQLFFEITLSWKDPRLAWELTSDNCATSILARASLDTELTEIWVPVSTNYSFFLSLTLELPLLSIDYTLHSSRFP